MFRIVVSDLLSKPGHSRPERGTLPITVGLPSASVDTTAAIEVTLTSLTDGVIGRGRAQFEVDLTCNRCLAVWAETMEVPFEQVFRHVPDDADDELPVEQGTWIDLEPPIHDEIVLALPLTPVCQPGCRGLCPTCGTDLNIEPCGGHGDELDSPFAALKQLFES